MSTETPTPDDAAPSLQTSGKPFGRPFRPGQSGNPSGRRRGSVSLRHALKRAASRATVEGIARKLIALAEAGELPAIRLVADLLGEAQLQIPADATTLEKIRLVSDAALAGEVGCDFAVSLSKILQVETNLADLAELSRRIDALEIRRLTPVVPSEGPPLSSETIRTLLEKLPKI